MSGILRPLAAGFNLGVELRRAAYRRGWFKTRRLNRPVVSVGNLTLGGSGKTPLVAFIAERLHRRGWKPVILTRGYGRRPKGGIVAIAPGSGRAPRAQEVGDEPALLARALPDVPIVVGANRYRAGRLAEERFDVDVHLLDDGFQHLALARDLDVVLLDVTQELSDRALLPAGRMREPLMALERAHLVVLTRVDLADPRPIEDRVRQVNPRARIFHCSTKLRRLVDVETGRIYPSGAFRGESVYAFCGIGNPKAFLEDLKKWGFSVVAEHAFGDHHVYGPGSVARLWIRSEKSKAVALVTTEKDAMNLPPLAKSSPPVVACVIEVEMLEAEAFEKALVACLEAARVKV